MLSKYYAKLITHTIYLSEITRNKALEVQTKGKNVRVLILCQLPEKV